MGSGLFQGLLIAGALGALARLLSPEEGTPAAAMPRRPSAATAERRALEVMSMQKKIWARKARAMVGKKFRALVLDRRTARLESQAPDGIDGVTLLTCDCTPGEFADVRICGVRGYDLTADPV